MRLADIKVPPAYKKHRPREGKVEEKAKLLSDGVRLSVTVAPDGTLIDGYAAYLAMLDAGFESCRAYVVETMAVVSGYHPAVPEKTYRWRLRFKGSDVIGPGDHLAVFTRFGIREMVVSDIDEVDVSEAMALRDAVGVWDLSRYVDTGA